MIATDRYRKSSFSETGACVEVRLLPDGTIGLRDSKDTSKLAHVFTPHEWTPSSPACAGEFDLPPERA